jgi:hypothetical protein
MVTTYKGRECGTAGARALHYHLHFTVNKPTKELGDVKMTNKEKGPLKGKRNEKKEKGKQTNKEKQKSKEGKIINNKVNETNPRKRETKTKESKKIQETRPSETVVVVTVI